MSETTGRSQREGSMVPLPVGPTGGPSRHKVTPEVLDLLAAITEALDVPLPGIDQADERAYHQLMERRMSELRTVVQGIVNYPNLPIGRDAAAIRKRTAYSPVTYTVWERPGEEQGTALVVREQGAGGAL